MANRLVDDATILAFRGIVEDNFDFTCTIERGVSPGVDRRNQELPKVWTAHLNELPCYYQPGKDFAAQGKRLPNMDVEYLLDKGVIKVAHGTDITVEDRLTNLRDRFNAQVQVGKLPAATAKIEILQIVSFKLTRYLIVKEVS
jgi:hypothetical protein